MRLAAWALLLACATGPAPKPAALDPSSPEAPEAPLPAPSTALDDVKPAPAAAPHPGYHCPMHPEVRQAEPGQCPHCGMHLEPVEPR